MLERLKRKPRATVGAVVEALAAQDVEVSRTYVQNVKYRTKKSRTRGRKRKRPLKAAKGTGTAKYPRHSLEKALRIPQAILEQNAGRECSIKESASYLGLGTVHGPYTVEVSSATKYGLLERPRPGRVKISDLARKVLRPQEAGEELQGLRQAVLNAPDISDVYIHYRGENLPDDRFFEHALEDTFGIPADKVSEFKTILFETLEHAQLLEKRGDKTRIIDFSMGGESAIDSGERLQELGKSATVAAGDACFVMMPFAAPHGEYYAQIYEPAIKKVGLKPIRADSSIFGAGKIMDQIWSGIHAARVLVAELTTKNPNVFYELGLAHAPKKPVVLVSSNEDDVPFDLHHIRVIYYDVNDPFWGNKLLEKVAENILSAIDNPEEAIFKGEVPAE